MLRLSKHSEPFFSNLLEKTLYSAVYKRNVSMIGAKLLVRSARVILPAIVLSRDWPVNPSIEGKLLKESTNLRLTPEADAYCSKRF